MLWLSVVVDEACTQIWEAWGSGASVTTLRVSPAVYAAVAAARPAETARDYPLMLLGQPPHPAASQIIDASQAWQDLVPAHQGSVS